MGGSGSRWGVRVDVNGELKKKKFGGEGSGGGGGQCGCEQRIELFVKIQKKICWGGGLGGQWEGSGGQWEGSGWGGGSGWM